MNKSLILLPFIILAMFGCEKDNSLMDSNDTFITDYEVETRSYPTQINSLSQFLNAVDGYGTVTQVTDNSLYTLKMDGIWDYTEAYVYEPYGKNEVHEIYVFTGNPTGYANAQVTCDQIYTDHGNGKTSCKNEGNTCKLTCVESGCEIETCLPS